ncbi:MAG: hypothetical protein DRG30_01430 [Epsilonproteobacteria bacterium]|nr:MAG: hypothetical protein DRG30_01430 [Campylobacterota bacterium]
MLEVKYLSLDALDPYSGNAKLHPPEQVQQIADSITEFGFNDPIAIDKDGTIIEGHGRYLASQLLGLKEVPTISLAHMDGTQQKAYILVHNQLTMSTGFDMDILQAEINAIMDENEDLVQLMGFTDDELDALECGIGEEEEIETFTDEEDTPDLEENPVIKFGDIIEFSNGSRLICGDSTDAETYTKLMNGNKATMVNTDPPYGVAYQSDKFKDIVNDDLTGDALKDFLIQCFKNLHRHTIENPALYVFHASITQRDFEDALEMTGFRVKQQIIWKKNQFAFGRSDYHWIHEPCFYAVKTEHNSKWYGDRCGTTFNMEDLQAMEKNELVEIIEEYQNTSSVWEISRDPTATYVHPTQKPVKLAARAIGNSSQKDDIVLEPFSGSGSTLIAGFQTGRKIYAIEFDTSYVQVNIQRLVEFSGEEMVTINGTVVNWYNYKKENENG